MPTILDNLSEIKQLDSQNMLGSLELIGKQVEQIIAQIHGLKLPAAYKKIQNIVVLGMGGSTLGAHVIKALFFDGLPVSVEIINGYHIPAYTNSKSLVVVSSYSGTTEEPVFAMKEAQKRKAKLLIISSGGLLAQAAKKNNFPALIYSTENNPCGSPRMGLGYSLFGPILLLSKLGIIRFGSKEIAKTLKTFEKYQALFGTSKNTSQNIAKQCAEKTVGKTTWYSGSEHLGGNVHVGANQMNENAKRFGGYFLIPELNHHLIEGMKLPISNAQNVLFICIESMLYDKRVQKRYEVTKVILEKNTIPYITYMCQEKSAVEQVAEVLVLTSYISYYSALLEGIDPTAIPNVNYLKEQLKK